MSMKEASQYYPKINPRYSLEGGSVYGEPDTTTLSLMDRLHGNVLEVGSGDGRYTHPMLDRKLEVVAGDVDEKALAILVAKTPKEHSDRVHPVIFDAFEPFPFPDKQFDGVVSTAFLYLFPKEYIRSFMEEAHRVTKDDGQVLIDFVTDRERLDADGGIIKGEKEIAYDSISSHLMLSNAVKDLFVGSEIKDSLVDQDLLQTAGYRMKAKKKSLLFEKQRYL